MVKKNQPQSNLIHNVFTSNKSPLTSMTRYSMCSYFRNLFFFWLKYFHIELYSRTDNIVVKVESQQREPQQTPSSSAPCYRCIQQDVLLQKQSRKIDSIESKYNNQCYTVNALRKRICYLNKKLASLQPTFQLKKLKELEHCTVCRRSNYPCIGNHICQENVKEIICDYCEKSFETTASIMSHLK